MPVIFDIGQFKIIIWTRDHSPPHVHCKAVDREVLIGIIDQHVVRNHGVSARDVKKLQAFVKSQSEVLLDEWRHYHGEK